MSKLALVNQYRYSPAAGGIGSFLKGIVNVAGSAVGLPQIFKKKQAAPPNVWSPAQMKQTTSGSVWGTAAQVGSELVKGALRGRGGGGGGGVRRGRGITARELRGYRKVANLIHKEGMVSKRARGRH